MRALGRPHRGATIASPRSGRALDILTTTPGLRLYMGQRLDGAPDKNGTAYGPHAGITAIAQARCVRLPERALSRRQPFAAQE